MNTQQNIVRKWSGQEEEQLLKEIKDGVDEQTIAKNHQRSVGGCMIRLKKIALRMYENNQSFEEIEEATGLKEDVILEQQKIENKQKNPQSAERKIALLKKKLQDIIDIL